ncbi:GDSL-type esterase/lipase family protein [Lacticaseibacillus kribbianus]|uniref:GDSL-type esterase/lipase family protein n=1 Tax=Lacticaseibacillus kribbianus TaxID=2926292 RepID=UPI001CD5DC65|nr:GDSL-type esterase/lipase family protein [Lacticaseibacillus kribbianus]
MLFEPNTTIVCAGDSVTDAGRNYDAEPGGWDSWGQGYVALINAALTAGAPAARLSVINAGVNGDTVVKLAARWDQDVLAHHPDYVSIMIGINDVWRFFDSQFRRRADLVDVALYTKTYQELIDRTQKAGATPLIVSPVMWELNLEDAMRAKLVAYQQAAAKLAAANGLLYIDAQAAVNRFLDQASVFGITMDRVHPNLQGSAVIAKAWLDAVGLDWRA